MENELFIPDLTVLKKHIIYLYDYYASKNVEGGDWIEQESKNIEDVPDGTYEKQVLVYAMLYAKFIKNDITLSAAIAKSDIKDLGYPEEFCVDVVQTMFNRYGDVS